MKEQRSTGLVADWQSVLASHPVNKTAAVVTGRSKDGVAADEVRERREDLCAALAATERAIVSAATPETRQAFGQRKLLLQDQLHELNVALKRHKTRPGYAQHFIDVARELLPKHLFRAISDQALKRDDAANAEPADASR